ncbi:type II toxin-antitoxin system VapC family toxin [Mariniphaga sp.]|uniref:type II toxin-antitoxin system VapC family toxin n=1 Tax=Mariniphaga sp. TaxID=1954475 RepID=UPI0035699B6C
MKVFIDANVIIAVLNKEYPLFTWASRLLSLQGKNNITLFTSPLCLAIAFYFSGKKSGEKLAKKKIEQLCRNMQITTIDEKITTQAISNPQVHDFEDGLEYYAALYHKCNFIVTENKEDFYFSEIEVLSCEEYLKKLKNDK